MTLRSQTVPSGDAVSRRREPYELILGDCVEVMAGMAEASIDAIVTDPPYLISFMDRAWDDARGGHEAWSREALRVLKPGGHLIAFGATRTVHRLACALEDVGFEIRDTIAWVQWQGFPKSMDVARAIDAAAGVEREVVGVRRDGVRNKTDTSHKQDGFGARRGAAFHETAPTSEDAKRWAGWGSGLKPAVEPAILARKPLVGTVAANVLRYGTGALNIDACRYAYGDPAWPGPSEAHAGYPNGPGGRSDPRHGWGAERSEDVRPEPWGAHDLGRWPANLYHCPKPDRGERDEGCEDLPQQVKAQLAGAAGGSTDPVSERFRSQPMGNTHPTVKPLALMRWLCRLVTPPGGRILDPFCGSGTTIIAALRENFRAIGIEKDEGYFEIARARIEGRDGPLFRGLTKRSA